MNNVSRTLRGQYSSSGSLRVVAGALCIAMFAPVSASNGQGAEAGMQPFQSIGGAPQKAYLDARVERTARREAKTETRRTSDESEPQSRPGDDRRSLKRALADGSNAAAAERRKHLTREERRALKRELRDAMQGANRGQSPD